VRSQEHLSTAHHCLGSDKKPIEIYFFIDPVCPECWTIEPILKKLQIEYGRYFSIKHVLSGKITDLNLWKIKTCADKGKLFEKPVKRTRSCYEDKISFNLISSPFIVSIAIKAAELQGRKGGIRFLRKFQEILFLQQQNVTHFDVLIECARKAGLDVDEFISDIHSESAAKAFQCDLKITAEMDVQETPTLVFFNENTEDEGIKITGVYPYEVYVQILIEMLAVKPLQAAPPPLEVFMRFFRLVASHEIATVYNMPISQVDREMKKLLLKQKVEQMPAKYGKLWRYIED
jgi:predicted DsbA family dithiol-disulfide isomerase